MAAGESREGPMETNSAKVLDETCNSNNEAYSDEVLYAAWAQPPALAAANDAALLPQFPEALRMDVDAFMARLYACQE